jgi:hypothetical protein
MHKTVSPVIAAVAAFTVTVVVLVHPPEWL